MKNTNFLFVLLATLLIFTGCSSDDDNPNSNSPILGTWSYNANKVSDWNNGDWIYDVEPISLEFSSDGTFIDKYDGEIDGEGTWSISGDTLAMTYEDIELGDETVYLEIVLLNDTTLRIKESYEDGTWEMEEFIRE